MTQTQQHCSTPDQLLTFLRGQLSSQQESELQLHLSDCVSCRERLENAAADANTWDEAKQFLGSRALHGSAEDSTSGLEEATQWSQRIRQVLDTLGPTDDLDSLGRIGGYEVTGVVGAGGMGVVLKAHDRSLDRIVAIKVMSPHLASSGSARKRFAREAKAAAAVLHPNVIAIHSVASEDASPFLVMPYVRGTSLQKRIDSQGPLPLKDTLRIGAQIAAGLAAAHEQGLVHRDIKPANILLEEGVERVTITDFGLARAVDDASMTCSGVIAGTPQYMSPEQTRGEPIDARSDLFSLGSVLYAICAGRSPFRAETTYGVLHRIANENPTPVCEVNSDVPVWLGHIIERLMAKRPDDRFESATQVAELLEGCLAHVQQPSAIPLPASIAALAPKKIRRLPFGKLIAAAFGAFALIFAGVLVVLELDKGTLTIESEADDVPIRIMRGNQVVKEMRVSQGTESTRISAGNYVVEFTGMFSGISVEGGSNITLERRGSVVVKITTDKTITNSKATNEVPMLAVGRETLGAPNAILNPDLERIKGEWRLTHVFHHSTLTDDSLCVIGQSSLVVGHKADQPPHKFIYTLRGESEIDLRPSNPEGLGAPQLGRYLFKDNLLYIAFNNDSNTKNRPVYATMEDPIKDIALLILEFVGNTETVNSERAANSINRVMQYLSAIQENDTEAIKSIAVGINNSDDRTREMSKLLADQDIPKLYKTWLAKHSAVVALGPITSSDKNADGRFLLFTLSLVDERWSIVDIDLKAKVSLPESKLETLPQRGAVPESASQSLQGTWEFISVERDGEVTQYKSPNAQLTIAGDKWMDNPETGSDGHRVKVDGNKLTFYGHRHCQASEMAARSQQSAMGSSSLTAIRSFTS